MKKIDELIRKYCEGESNQEEEKEIRSHFAKNDAGKSESLYFQYLNERQNEALEDPEFDTSVIQQLKNKKRLHRSIFKAVYWRVAAAIIILCTAGILFMKNQSEKEADKVLSGSLVLTDTYDDPEKAFEETKKALLYISNQLNKGNEYTVEFGKFSETQEKLKKEN